MILPHLLYDLQNSTTGDKGRPSGRTQFAPTIYSDRFCRGDRPRAVGNRPLGRGIQHIFNKNAVAGGGVVDEDMGHSADEFPVLNDGTS